MIVFTPIRQGALFVAILCALFVSGSPAYSNSVWQSAEKTLNAGTAVIAQSFPGTFTALSSDHAIVQLAPGLFTKTFAPPVTSELKASHVVTFDWTTKKGMDTTGQIDIHELLLFMVPSSEAGPAGLNGFGSADIPSVGSVIFDLDFGGILSPTALGTVAVTDIASVFGAASILDPLLAVGASGDVPYAIFEVPVSAFVPEPSAVMLSAIGLLTLVGRSRQRR